MGPRYAFFAAALIALCQACEPAPPPPAGAPAQPGKEKEKSSLIFRGFGARASRDGALMWEAHAERARVNRQGQGAHAEVVTLTYFRNSKVVSRARADRAEIDLKDYDIVADGAVEVRSSQGVILRTPHLNWDNKAQRISSESKVVVVRGHTQLSGRGFTGDRDLRDVRILSDVQAEAASVDALREDSKTWPRP
jgi:LPS export ABC transporter protein LptC